MDSLLNLGAVIAVIVSAFTIVWSTLRTGISPMPSSQKARRAILDLLDSEHPGPIYELGSGWGQLAIDLARQNPQRDVVGYEMSLLPYLYARLSRRALGVANVSFRRENFFNAPLQEAPVWICYLYPGAMTRLAESLSIMDDRTVLIISNTFRLPGFEAEHTLELNDLHRTYVYRYLIQSKHPQTLP